MIEIIIGIIVIISFLSFIFVIFNNKYELVNIKIDKANEDIELYLKKKIELLDRTRPIIKKALKTKEFMEDLDKIPVDAPNIEVNSMLKKIYNELFKALDEHEKLYKSDALVKILDELNNTEEDIIGAIKFYNDTVVEFNKLVVSFPSNIIALFKRYKKMDFYNNEKREIFEILNKD
ncbi:MAG: LemA family protein [Bacilli bacterium]|nr:LemA family protein [Bacilli bacterium]